MGGLTKAERGNRADTDKLKHGTSAAYFRADVVDILRPMGLKTELTEELIQSCSISPT
jgi:hypothetical protein